MYRQQIYVLVGFWFSLAKLRMQCLIACIRLCVWCVYLSKLVSSIQIRSAWVFEQVKLWTIHAEDMRGLIRTNVRSFFFKDLVLMMWPTTGKHDCNPNIKLRSGINHVHFCSILGRRGHFTKMDCANLSCYTILTVPIFQIDKFSHHSILNSSNKLYWLKFIELAW